MDTGASTSKCSPYGQFICYGDSITEDQRFSAFLRRDYVRRLDVENRGFSGYTTQNFLHIYESLIPPTETTQVKLCTLFFGANDACIPGASQHVPIEDYKKNLGTLATTIVRRLSVQGRQPSKLILIVPPPVNEYSLDILDRAHSKTIGDRTAVNTAKYAAVCREAYQDLPADVKENTRLLDAWEIFYQFAAQFEHHGGQKSGGFEPILGSRERTECQGLKRLLADGLHLTDEGYALLRTHLNILIAQNWPELQAENMPMVFQPWAVAPK